MTTSPVRWGILSTANIGRRAVIPAIGRSSNGAVHAVASRSSERASAFAAEHDIPTAYGTYEALLDDPDIDAIYIPLPNSLHREWTIRTAQAHKHILCEKPLALTASDCLEMQAAADEHGVCLMEAFMYRFHPRTQLVREMVSDGAIGGVRAIEATFTFRLTGTNNIRLDPEMGGGSLLDVGCYCVNVARTMAGAEPVEVVAQAEWAPSGIDHALAGILRFPSGTMAVIRSALTLDRCEFYRIGGDGGYLDVRRAFLPGTDETTVEVTQGRSGLTVQHVRGVDEYQVMVEHFAECVQKGEAPRYSAAEAAANMRVIEALYRSARGRGCAEPV